MTNQLESLRKMTTIVCDSGDIHAIEKWNPQDATTNPSLIFAASQEAKYHYLIDDAILFGKCESKNPEELTNLIMEKLFVNFGLEILKLIPGRISTEVEARLSFDVEGSIHKAQKLVALYEKEGIDRKRLLIKLASTWEGIQAARRLEKEGIHCNMTLLFDLNQALACAEAGATLISPFVGRILDWYKSNGHPDDYPKDQDPGVLSVKTIYTTYKKHGIKTEVMGASFRNCNEITELAGCDLLTISPKLLQELASHEGELERKLHPEPAKESSLAPLDEKSFRWNFNENQMATEKLSDGIRRFHVDQLKLEKFVMERALQNHKS